jgi:hypothetical protein
MQNCFPCKDARNDINFLWKYIKFLTPLSCISSHAFSASNVDNEHEE